MNSTNTATPMAEIVIPDTQFVPETQFQTPKGSPDPLMPCATRHAELWQSQQLHRWRNF
jgi:hypothetical protein